MRPARIHQMEVDSSDGALGAIMPTQSTAATGASAPAEAKHHPHAASLWPSD